MLHNVHRLDKETSGCLVLSKNGESATSLGKEFKARRVEKIYWIMVAGNADDSEQVTHTRVWIIRVLGV